MHIILVGATGLVGSSVLDALINMKDVSKISILSRRPVPMAEASNDARINVILHRDFGSYNSEVLQKLEGATGCVWALGVSQNDVGKDEYVKITRDYAAAAASAFRFLPSANSTQPFNFIFVSGTGATHTPGMFTSLFGRVKGETELALANLRKENPRLHANTVRPGVVDWTGHDAILPFVPRQGLIRGVLAPIVFPVVRVGYKAESCPTEPLGMFLAEMAMGRYGEEKLQGAGVERLAGGSIVVSNAGFRRLTGLDS